MWEKRKPNIKSLQAFGCNVYAKVLGSQKKLNERSRELTFVGYALVGYRLWDLQKRKMVIARDVKFEKINITYINKSELWRLTWQDEDEEQEQEYDNPAAQQEEEENEEFCNLRQDEGEDSDAQEQHTKSNSKKELRRSKRITKRPDKYGEYVLLTYKEAITGPDKYRWMEAINEEKNSQGK